MKVQAQNEKAPVAMVSRPEVKPSKAPRRAYTADYKLRVLKEADVCRGESGAVSALLRREGIYSSLLSEWRKQRDNGALSAFSIKRGRRAKRTAPELEMDRLRTQNAKLEERLRQANLIIEVQKKIAALLGNPIETSSEDPS